ncbi:hypothetical protein [Nocardia puris]|uniref:Uncharacterized protein n=1 Tax=Nocardia puris TaxID=208602 RepID=A0A366CW77_9NOCA|nr:hypothetical protein [Nocardia puris]RBO82073.1 hypothetical protein DFR74_12528 [Nocardia puris]
MILRAREAFSYTDHHGVPRIVRPGDLVEDSDPGVKGREHLYEPVEVAAARSSAVVEQATAAPGEKRAVSTRKTGGTPKS